VPRRENSAIIGVLDSVLRLYEFQTETFLLVPASNRKRSTKVMRVALVLVVSTVSALAQTPLVRRLNTSRPASRNFQIGDEFEILITGAPKQPISVRTIMNGTTDWSPVIASTDDTGRWSTTGRFEKNDFGDASEIWTVGGKLASPRIDFEVEAPCLPGSPSSVIALGLPMFLSCETAEGHQTFASPSDSFRTPDGRIVPTRKPGNMTSDEYHMDILQYLITSQSKDARTRVSLQSSRGGRGDEVAGLIARLIGVNALSDDETRNVLAVIHATFEMPETIAPSARVPSKTLELLHHLSDMTDQDSLKQQIADTIAYVQER
jgi:hypothetical protein